MLKSNPERQTDATEADGTLEEGPSKQKHSCVQRPGAEREHTLVVEGLWEHRESDDKGLGCLESSMRRWLLNWEWKKRGERSFQIQRQAGTEVG